MTISSELDLTKPYTSRLKGARKFAVKRYNELRQKNYYRHHYSFDATQALEEADKEFHLEMFGVEGDCELNGEGHFDILYLNTGDTYVPTICFYNGKFIVSDWGTIAEKHNN